jgi:hypothetical protein
MRTRTKWGIRGGILNQAGKITMLPVTGEVRSKLEHSLSRGRMYEDFYACCLSKNGVFHNTPATIVPVLHGNHALPTG